MPGADWTEMPLHIVLYEWLVKNMNVPTDLGTLIAYIAFILLIIYTIAWFVRMVMSVLWPLFIISTAIIAFQLLQNNSPDDLTDLLAKSFGTLTTSLTNVLDGIMDFLQKITTR